MSEAGILRVEAATKRFGGIVAVDEASLEVARGSITALIGPNGAGKTTLFNVVSGFYRPDRGAIWFAGERIDGRPAHAIAQRGLVRTFQITKALTRLSVLDNVMLAARDHPGERLWNVALRPRAVSRQERRIRYRAMDLLHLVRLDHLAFDYAGTLSGGQRKLLEFARALMTDPVLVLLDEPMAGVNPTLGQDLLSRMKELRADLGMTFLLIEHDMQVVMAVSDRVIVMNGGKVIADGTPDAVRRDERVVDAYLGTH